jgi:hypothetical protein
MVRSDSFGFNRKHYASGEFTPILINPLQTPLMCKERADESSPNRNFSTRHHDGPSVSNASCIAASSAGCFGTAVAGNSVT